MNEIGKYFYESDADDRSDEGITLGSVSIPELASIELKQDRLHKKRAKIQAFQKYDVIHGKSLFGREIHQFRKRRLFLPLDKVVYDSGGRKHRLFFRKRHTITENTKDYQIYLDDYRHLLQKREEKKFHKRLRRENLYRMGHKMFDDGHLRDDENMAELNRSTRRYFNRGRRNIKQGIRTIKLQNNDFVRLRNLTAKQQLLETKKERLYDKEYRKEYKERIQSASSKYQKHKLKKEMASAIRQREGNRAQRLKSLFLFGKRSSQQKIRAAKRIISTIFSIGGIFLGILLLLGIGIMLLISIASGAGHYAGMAITQNDYVTLSDSSAYLKKLETDLEEYLLDREALQIGLEAEYGPDLYEFIYELPEIGFNSTTLMAYLSAKYGSFTLEQVQAELDSIFQQMYTLEIEVKEELREVTVINPDTGEEERVEELKRICYIRLLKKELEEVAESRMTAEEKEQYGNYKLSSGGQQVYGPVMLEDWTDLISSDYGERIHPVTGERTFHNGVDIAIPTGTKLYSAVSGTVTVAQYSESAGNYVRVQTDTGWAVTFMHMDTLAVSPGQVLEKGDFVGHSGNTGRSTGPHLHLEVRDANNNPINPIFIVPQNCYMAEEENT